MPSLFVPPCHWTGCSHFGKPMTLLNESDTFWFFACGCGCTRAVSKPSTRERSLREHYDRSVAQLRRNQRAREASRVEYSLPSPKGSS
jgi:hypothetical protein